MDTHETRIIIDDDIFVVTTQLREARAILREMTESDPILHIEAKYDSGDNVHICRYCGVEQAWPYDAPVHDLNCLYVRVRALLGEPPA